MFSIAYKLTISRFAPPAIRQAVEMISKRDFLRGYPNRVLKFKTKKIAIFLVFETSRGL